MAENIMTPEFRVSYANVFRPGKAMQPGAEPKYGVTMLFPKHADLSMLRKAAEAAAKEKWGDKIPKGLRSPFRDQGEKDSEGYEEGCVFINATSQQKPGIVYPHAGADGKPELLTVETDFYSGCYARATVRAFAYDKAGNRGVTFGLQNIQKTRDGDPLGGRTRPSDDFEPVTGGDDKSGSGGAAASADSVFA